MANDVYTDSFETGFTFSGATDTSPAARPETPRAEPRAERPQTRAVPRDFGYEDEHPLLRVPFTLHVDGCRHDGDAVSVTHIHTHRNEGGTLGVGTKHLGLLHFAFENFAVTLHPQVTVLEERADGRCVFQFTDPVGEHLPQLRYILNNVIAGDFVTIGGLISYTGPTQPKRAKDEAAKPMSQRVRSIIVMILSALLILMAAYTVFKRYTTAYELHPIFIESSGQQMRATGAGQISYLNPQAKKGEVVYSINANTGDVLNFQMPCDCEVAVAKGISEGATVLPTDLILTIFVNRSEIGVQTLMSIEGLSRAMNGDQVHMDLNDGRSIPVRIVPNETTSAATMRGDLFVPVEVVPPAGALTEADIGKAARLRLSKSLPGAFGLTREASP
ncbi:hypothetical protein [Thetidibacter halocola]|uniref:Alginate biosynthesis protein Alg44 n=1 Tax=Thetidibacter halocola TaxID=2827239 RepID=A0A8J7W9G3_9RHOB|nr:hypothetical protein [Thetidibacter halocola]MBS0123415.1 hypothetical protein [Thetidibacter halocola]